MTSAIPPSDVEAQISSDEALARRLHVSAASISCPSCVMLMTPSDQIAIEEFHVDVSVWVNLKHSESFGRTKGVHNWHRHPRTFPAVPSCISAEASSGRACDSIMIVVDFPQAAYRAARNRSCTADRDTTHEMMWSVL